MRRWQRKHWQCESARHAEVTWIDAKPVQLGIVDLLHWLRSLRDAIERDT
jgi:hypothetical protein